MYCLTMWCFDQFARSNFVPQVLGGRCGPRSPGKDVMQILLYTHTFIVIVSSTRSNTIITIMTIIDYLLYDIVITISITVILYYMRIYIYICIQYELSQNLA